MAETAMARRGVSIALASRTLGVSETCYRYAPRLVGENEEIADLLEGLTNARRNWGFGLCFLYLRNVQGRRWNHKRVYRIYRELNLRIKPRKRMRRDKPDRLLSVLDDFNHEGLGIEVDFSLPAERVVRSLNRIIEWRGKPASIRVDNGPEYISGKLLAGAKKLQIKICHIQPGQPQQNACAEHYNWTVRHEWLDQNIIGSTMLYRSTTHRRYRCSAAMENLDHRASFQSEENIAPLKSGIKQLS